MKIHLYRHAPTAGNLKKQYLGSTNQPLCPAGVALARAAFGMENLAVTTVYHSGLLRCGETAAILFPKAKQVAVPGLAEMDFGRFEAHSWDELKDDADYQSWLNGGQTAPCPGGESRAAFTRRCLAAFGKMAGSAAAGGEKDLYAVVYGGTLMAVLSALATPEKDYFDWQVPFCGGFVLDYDAEAAINDGSEAGATSEAGPAARPLRLAREIPAPAPPAAPV